MHPEGILGVPAPKEPLLGGWHCPKCFMYAISFTVDCFLVPAYLRAIMGLIPDHRSEASIIIKQVIIFYLVEDLAFNL